MSKWPRPVQRVVSTVATALSVATAAWAQGEVKPEFVERIEQALPDQTQAKPAKPRKLLVFYKTEGFVHGSIPTGNFALKRLGEKSGAYTADFSNDMKSFDEATLFTYDAVLFNNTTQLKFTDPQHRANLLRFIKEGRGMAGIHAASDNFGTWPEAACLIGGQFDGHPWGAGYTVAVQNDDPDHPINACFCGKGFEIKDEIYQMKGCFSRDTQRVLLSLDWGNPMNHKVDTTKLKRADRDFGISWVKQEGAGRVFYCSLGHNDHVYWDAAVLRHYLAGIQYALGDLQADAKPMPRKSAVTTP
jgi:type 1 glutamine amidotransferase